VANEEEFDAAFDDALDVAFGAISAESGSSSGRVTLDERLKCAERTLQNNSLTIDFGEGCEGPRGRVRKGKIIVTFTDKFWMPESVITATFEDFYFNDLQLEGSRTITNLSTSLDDYPKQKIELKNGKLTWPDGSFITREATRTRLWKRAANPLNDEIEVFGTATGTNKNGVKYTSTVAEETPVVLKRACWSSKVFVPVQGIKVITRDSKPAVTIDYGDGTCDKLLTLTVGEIVKEVDLDDLKNQSN
jgi:hypothetical protein